MRGAASASTEPAIRLLPALSSPGQERNRLRAATGKEELYERPQHDSTTGFSLQRGSNEQAPESNKVLNHLHAQRCYPGGFNMLFNTRGCPFNAFLFSPRIRRRLLSCGDKPG